MTAIATLYVDDERYQIDGRPNHLHQRFPTSKEAWRWIHDIEEGVGRRLGPNPEVFEWDEGYRCPRCGWTDL